MRTAITLAMIAITAAAEAAERQKFVSKWWALNRDRRGAHDRGSPGPR